ncbi:MAG: HIT family protein [Candidatus Nanohalobium sp.]
MTDCIFCSLEKGVERNVVFKSENFRIVLDQFPLNFGHCLIIPKSHVDQLEDLSDEEFLELKQMISKAKKLIENHDLRERYRENLKDPVSEKSADFTEQVIDQEGNPEGFNIGVNSNRVAGRTIDHLHIQVIPRYEGDVENPEGGIRNVIPRKADYT